MRGAKQVSEEERLALLMMCGHHESEGVVSTHQRLPPPKQSTNRRVKRGRGGINHDDRSRASKEEKRELGWMRSNRLRGCWWVGRAIRWRWRASIGLMA